KDEDIDKMVKEAEQFADDDKKRRAEAEAKNNAESLIHSTEKQLAEHGDKVSAEIKTEIETALAEAKTAVESGDPEQMTEKTNALTQAAMKLGQAMYEQQQAAGGDAAGGAAGGEAPGAGEEAPQEDVVDAEFSEVDDEHKS
ncbi:MAG: Hsp70 family protein, partial [Pseudomonadota bacterium]|nr:Hsp70 family protein [Pseudomonadota bacterium]